MSAILPGNVTFVKIDDRGVVVQSGQGPIENVRESMLSQPGYYLAGSGDYTMDGGKILDLNTLQLTNRSPLTKTFSKSTVKADGVDTTSIPTLKKGSHVNVWGPEGNMIDQDTDSVGLTLSFDVPGTYKVTIEEFPATPTTMIIEAIE